MEEQNLIYKTPTLKGLTKKGKNKYWEKHVIALEDNIYTKSVYWQENSLVQESALCLITKKNVGKSNETSLIEQAILEAHSEVRKQLDKGYTLSDEPLFEIKPLPMLAQDYIKYSSKLPEEVIVEPKLDGTRCLTNGKNFWTRKGKPYLSEIKEQFGFDNDEGLILDGELILPAPYTFQHTVSAVKKYSDLTDKLEYWVYDLLEEELCCQKRKEKLSSFLRKISHPKIKILPFIFCEKPKIFQLHNDFVGEGFEGTIIRNPQANYEINHRSFSLLKLKDFNTDEFEIIGIVDGEAKEKNLAIFVCVTERKEIFNCRPEGDVETRKEIFLNKENYLGKLLTVRYQGFTRDRQVPRFPVGVSVRDYE